MRKIFILGLASLERAVSVSELLAGEVWTLNDWYGFHGWLARPKRVYQIHKDFDFTHPADKTRYRDCRKYYELSGAEIVTCQDYGFSRQRIMNIESLVEKFGVKCFQSTLGYMFAEAIDESVDIIELAGVKLSCFEEFYYQIPSVLLNIDIAREKGVKVIAHNEEEWRAQMAKINWAEVQEVNLRYE